MGLDMFLVKKKKSKTNKEIYDYLETNKITEIAYWRKANQIHKWIVDNIQNGNDDCKSYKISKEKIEELVSICNKILKEAKLIDGKILEDDYYQFNDGEKTHILEYGIGKVIANSKLCEELLPIQKGFFFGSTQYDEWYLDDIKYTRDRLQAILDLLDFDKWDVYYESSW